MHDDLFFGQKESRGGFLIAAQALFSSAAYTEQGWTIYLDGRQTALPGCPPHILTYAFML